MGHATIAQRYCYFWRPATIQTAGGVDRPPGGGLP